ncbi:PH domain-containing protein [Companilactobacillus furfuricola]|uniref:PH domain-containing protein n=1 Tax=Companilactobacillus furfuricola TaxID=1462575 RepID=UPI000F7AD0DE|nr:PH domain-containing protein [Companilactobacillus furfuricola]
MTSNAQHLHPVALLYFLFRDIINMIVPFVVTVIAVANVLPNVPILLLVVIVTILVLATSTIRFFRFTFQLKRDEIVVKHGIFVRHNDHVPYDRIQNITTDQWFFLKPFGVEKLEIETASHAEKSEVTLFAVPVELKDQLENLRNQGTTQESVPTESATSSGQTESASVDEKNDEQASNTYAITKKDLIKFALTSPAFLSGLLVVLAAYGKFEQAISDQMYEYLFKQASHLGILIVILLIVAVLLLFYIGSVLILINQYYNFKLVEKSNQFITTKGFFKTKKTTISFKRVQAVLVKQPLLRQWLNIATVQLVIISNSKQGDSEKDIIVMPVIIVGKVDSFLNQFFPSIPVQKVSPYQPSKWTYYYNLRNATLLTLANAIILIALLHFWPWLCVALVIIDIGFWYVPAILTMKRTKAQVLDENYLAIRNNRVMTKQLVLIPRETIQSAEKRQSIWLEKKGVASLTINLRSGTTNRKFNTNYQLEQDVDAVLNWYKAVN